MLLNEIKALEEVEKALRCNLTLPALADKVLCVLSSLTQREQQEPVGYLVYSLDGVSFQDSYCEGAEPVYTPPPSVEAAIEATKEKAAKVCEEIMEYGEYPDCEAEQCAAAIRGLK